MTPEAVNDFATILALTAIIPALGYTLTYGLGSPWYRSLLGIVLFGLGASVATVLSVVLLRRILGAYPGYEWVAVSAYSILTLTMWALWAIVIVERRRAPMLKLPLTRKEESMTTDNTDHTEAGTVPPIWYKAQRVVRTIVQTLIVLVPILNGLAAAAVGYLNEQTDVTVPGWVFLVLNGVIAVTALIIGLVARLMAVPGVNEWLTNIGLGSVPKRAVVGTTGWGDASIIPDPKV